LTHWIRDYVFMSSYKVAATRFPSAARTWSYVLLFVALFVAGVWHGTTAGFVMFGALNGLGVEIARAYGDGLRAALGRARVHAYLKNRAVQAIAVLVAVHYACFAHLFFALSVHQAGTLLQTAWADLARLPSGPGDSA
jgi:D-alanyl-lipoteichoic acid acyltransferase DltB (MBOAT superfamily)